MQIEYGLMTDPEGRPVGIDVFAGNTPDPESFKSAISKARTDFGLKELVFVGDRGMITKTRIADLRKLEGARWVTALRAPDIAALAVDDGPLQMSLFDEQDLAEISHPDYPGERLVCCRNPALKLARAYKRQALLEATGDNLSKIAKSVKSGRLKDPDKIGVRVGKIINKNKVGKHFIWEIKDGNFEYRRDEEKITREAAIDGIYVIRASLPEEEATSPDLVRIYKNLKHVERDFRSIKIDDLDVHPIYHFLTRGVESHMLICMLAAYLTWHLRKTFAPLTFTDQNIPAATNPVTPAGRSREASLKDSTQLTKDDLPVYRYRDLLDHLATLSRQAVNFNGQRIEKITIPTPIQARAFELLGGPVPVALT